MQEDITYCANTECRYTSCDRNPQNIRQPMLHSFAELEGTEYCQKGEKTCRNQKGEQKKVTTTSNHILREKTKTKNFERCARTATYIAGKNTTIWNAEKDPVSDFGYATSICVGRYRLEVSLWRN